MEANSMKVVPPDPAPTPMPASPPKSAYVYRFDVYSRISHAALMVSFLGLAGTGLPLLFSHERWAWWLSRLWGGYAAAAALHRFFAIILIATFAAHVVKIFYRVAVKRDFSMLWGPTSMVPQPRDIVEMFRHMKWFVGLGPRPRFERYTYWEKFDYWAVFWGMFIIGGSGLILWFPTLFAHLVPGWVLNIAELIHGEEALLAVGFIFTVHFFNGHLRPGKFPMDLVIFTGSVRDDELRHERAGEYARLVDTGALAQMVVAPPSAALSTRGYLVGTAGLTIGLALVTLILYAVLR